MTINCKGQLIDLSNPKVMGILNITQNSFFDGGKWNSFEKILSHVEQMLNDGATFIDVGAYSSKPNAEFISEEQEIAQIVPVIKLLLEKFPNILISIDTFRAKVAEICIIEGAAIINDISAGNLDEQMLPTIAKLQVPYIMMHMRGNPQTMQSLTDYENLIKEVLFYFSEKIAEARTLGINDIIVDPGYGFSKTLEQNYELMQQSELLKLLELPILVGVSRKSMIYKALDTTADNALNGTTFLHAIALTKGASILRVHDVKEAVEAVKLFGILSQK
ncbi:MAG: dihydropteroate synthase [Flavobacterium sp.]